MSRSEVAVSVRGLSKRYDIALEQDKHITLAETILSHAKNPLRRAATRSFWALKDINFDIKKGEVIGIVGRNGAGKSTLLKILSRITEPTTGRVDLYGRVGSLLEVGTGFHPELTGRENVFLNGAILGMSKGEIRNQFDAIVDFAGVEQFLDTPVKRYSSGMYVRLAFAVAAHLNPEILIIDEVLAVGDAEFQKKCLGKMQDVSRTGRTVLFVSHNLNAVAQLCNTAMILNKGNIQLIGQAEDVLEKYASSGTAAPDSVWVLGTEKFDNDHVRPLRFAVVDEQGGSVAGPLRNDRQYWIEMDVEILEKNGHLEIGYGVFLRDGLMLFWTFHTDGPDEKWPELQEGIMRLRSPWPMRLLNEGTYRLELLAALHQQSWLIGTGSPASITVEIAGGLSDSPHFNHKRGGLLAPVMEWTAEPVNPLAAINRI